MRGKNGSRAFRREKMAYFKLPAGVHDVLPEACYNLDLVKEKLKDKFSRSGFDFIETAGLEYYDTYAKIKSPIEQTRLFKTTDYDGNLIVLRPDMTLACARIAATKLKAAARLCYFSRVYDFSARGNFLREAEQAGVEIFGESGAFADAFCVALAVDCLAATGLKNFIIDIGHVGFYKGLLEELGLDYEKSEELRAYVNAKDGVNTELFLKENVKDGRAAEAILALPSLFGGAEVLEEAKKLTANAGALSALSHLQKVYGYLKEMGYENCVSFDLGTVKSLSYYSGMVFTGLAGEVGAPVLSGGRYDKLALEFGKDLAAVGFAIGLDRLLTALERQGDFKSLPDTEVTVACAKGGEIVGYNAYRKWLSEGVSCRLLVGETAQEELSGAKGIKYLATAEGLKKC